jgi:hypothetical protein
MQRSPQIVLVAILLAIKQYYGLGIEAVQEPVGVRLDALVPLVVQRERSMAWVVGVFNTHTHSSQL